MRSKIARRILSETPDDVKVFVKWYGDVVVLIKKIMDEKGYTQRDLAKKLDKSPSEISKWLKGEHNFTLRSLAKLQVELGEPLLHIPKRKDFKMAFNKTVHFTVYKNTQVDLSTKFVTGKIMNESKSKSFVA
jgi:transcriptional regulator with XRE-family HTH domain